MKTEIKQLVYFTVLIVTLGLVSCTSSRNIQENTSYSSGHHSNYRPRSSYRISSMLIEAKKEMLLSNHNAAISTLNKVIELDPENDAAYFELARLYNQKNNFSDALLFIEKAAEIDPDNKWYQFLLADLYIKNDKYKEASELYEDLVSKNPENLDYLFDLALSYLYSGDYNKALNVYEEIEEKSGLNTEIIEQKKKIYIHLGKTEKAAEEIKKLISFFPDEIRYYSMLAEFYMSNDKKEQALEIYNTISQKFPEDPYIHVSMADYYHKAGKKEKAFEELSKGFANPELDIDTKIQLMLTWYSITELFDEMREQAMDLALTLTKAHPDNPKSYSMLADFLLREEKYGEAEQAFKKVLSLDSSRYIIWENILNVFYLQFKYDDLLEYSEKAIALFPVQPALYLYKGIALIHKKEYEQSISILKKGLDYIVFTNSMEAQFYSFIGDAYYNLKEYEKSDEAYDIVLTLDPENSYVLNNYAYYLSLREVKLEKALIMAQKAVKLDPDNASNMDTYAWVLYKLKRYEEAREWVEKALKIDKTNAVLFDHLGDIYFQSGNTNKAIINWKKALEIKPDAKEIKQKISEEKIND